MILMLFFACSFPVDQRASCAQYVACIEARDARDGTATNLARFDADGDCWGTDRGADLCEAACTKGLAFLAASEADAPAACTP